MPSAMLSMGHNTRGFLLAQHVRTDSVYFYSRKENNHDSSLAVVENFDSLGNLTRREEFGLNGEVQGVSDYIYADTTLLQQATVSKSIFYINGSNLTRLVKTYDQNDSGYIIAERDFSYFGDSLKLKSVTEWNRTYDAAGKLAEEYIKLPGSQQFLHHTYTYSSGRLAEIKTYDIDKSWSFSYLYDYDETGNLEDVFLVNKSKTLIHKFFYEEGRLVRENVYEQGGSILNHTTQSYFYKPNGLIGSQIFEKAYGGKYYYKYFYTR